MQSRKDLQGGRTFGGGHFAVGEVRTAQVGGSPFDAFAIKKGTATTVPFSILPLTRLGECGCFQNKLGLSSVGYAFLGNNNLLNVIA